MEEHVVRIALLNVHELHPNIQSVCMDYHEHYVSLHVSSKEPITLLTWKPGNDCVVEDQFERIQKYEYISANNGLHLVSLKTNIWTELLELTKETGAKAKVYVCKGDCAVISVPGNEARETIIVKVLGPNFNDEYENNYIVIDKYEVRLNLEAIGACPDD